MIYKPSYSHSHALVIGINDYVAASPLAFAVADAKAVSQILQARFEFPTANVTLLLDEHATKAAILKAFFAYSLGSTGPDDRLIVFFAGHGQTVEGRRGDVGYLVPHDGDPDDLGSLIRWRELTEGADMFDAKHVLFLMDACYGGLAVTRARPAGSMRFMRDMLRRGSRQVLRRERPTRQSATRGDRYQATVPSLAIYSRRLAARPPTETESSPRTVSCLMCIPQLVATQDRGRRRTMATSTATVT